MYCCTNRYITNWQCVTHSDWSILAGHDYRINLQTAWRNNITTLTISITNQSYVSGTIWIVLYTLYTCWDVIFSTTEVDNTVVFAMTAPTASYCNVTIMITA